MVCGNYRIQREIFGWFCVTKLTLEHILTLPTPRVCTKLCYFAVIMQFFAVYQTIFRVLPYLLCVPRCVTP